MLIGEILHVKHLLLSFCVGPAVLFCFSEASDSVFSLSLWNLEALHVVPQAHSKPWSGSKSSNNKVR